MTQAADLIDYLLARDLVHSVPKSGHARAVAVFDGRALIEWLAARPLRPNGGLAPRLSWFQGFRRLWWQHWEPRPRDQRDLHWYGIGGSLLVHLLFAALLVWVAVVRWATLEPESEAGRVQLAFIGRGTPDQQGGGQGGAVTAMRASAPAGARIASRAPPRSLSAATPAVTSVQAASEPRVPALVEAEPVSPPVPPMPERVATAPTKIDPAQPLPRPTEIVPTSVMATDTPVATADFVVPPPPPLPIPEPAVASVSTPQVRERQVVMPERPSPMQMRSRELVPPTMPPLPVTAVRERQVSAVPRPSVELAVPVPRQASVPALVVPEVVLRPREPADLPVPAAEPVSPPAAVAQRDAAPTATVSTPAPVVRVADGAQPEAGPRPALTPPGVSVERQAGAGSRPAERSSGWASPKDGDDWGLGERSQAGQSDGASEPGDGLYNRDGSLRVPGQREHGNDGGAAPGSAADAWSRDRIAQSGTWLKRPPYDYTPTSFDQYWVPKQTLLEQWVRQGIKKIEIAIPGTSTRISCVVSLLQFGGGCGLTDPNKNEQPASARPPPDIPFKKELQQDNGSLR